MPPVAQSGHHAIAPESKPAARVNHGQAGPEDLRTERRLGRYAGVAAIGAVAATAAALIVAARAVTPRARLGDAPGQATWLSDLSSHSEAHAVAVGLRSAALLLTIAAGIYLYRVVRVRHGSGRPLVLWLGILSPLLVLAVTVAGYLVIINIADTFTAGPRSEVRADDLITASERLRVVRFVEWVSRLGFGIWVVLISLDAMRVGALTRVVGYWGVIAGVAVAMQFTPGEALLAGWIGSIGVLFLGYWPGGRPETWETGRPTAPTF